MIISEKEKSLIIGRLDLALTKLKCDYDEFTSDIQREYIKTTTKYLKGLKQQFIENGHDVDEKMFINATKCLVGLKQMHEIAFAGEVKK